MMIHRQRRPRQVPALLLGGCSLAPVLILGVSLLLNIMAVPNTVVDAGSCIANRSGWGFRSTFRITTTTQQRRRRQQYYSYNNDDYDGGVVSQTTSLLEVSTKPRHGDHWKLAKECRGGAIFNKQDSDDEDEYENDEYENDEYENDEEEDETGVESSSGSSSSSSSPIIRIMVKSLFSVSKAVFRAVKAAFQEPPSSQDDDNNKELSLVERVLQTLQRMWTAAMDTDGSSSAKRRRSSSRSRSAEEATPRSKPARTKSSSTTEPPETMSSSLSTDDFGSYLARAYGATDGRLEEQQEEDNIAGASSSSPSPILGGSLNDALKIARSNARLAVILIPSAAPPKKHNPTSADVQAITSFLSADVAKIAQKKARKKGGETASFVLWATKAGSPEAIQALKRLSVFRSSKKNDKRPVLLVAYPAPVMNSRTGVVKLVPKVLAQHHCRPPPSATAMAEWMNELRKRHAKQYAAMQHDVKEAQLFQERKEGYQTSVRSDAQRQRQEQEQLQEQVAQQQAQQERLEALTRRRQELLESLPDEPPQQQQQDVHTISIRSMDGRSGKRRFSSDTPLKVVFDWVDAMFQVEREVVILTTLNGKQTFSWDDVATTDDDDGDDEKTLSNVGLGRMVGFRVTVKKPEEPGGGDATAATGEESSKDKAS